MWLGKVTANQTFRYISLYKFLNPITLPGRTGIDNCKLDAAGTYIHGY
jgi:hypothetical protein